MPHHGNEEEHESEPVSFRDNRKIDPETGNVRGQQSDAETPVPDSSGAGGRAAPAESGSDQDALAQAEAILNEAGADGEANAAVDVVGELRDDLLRLQAEYVNYRRRVERDRDVAREQAVIGVLNSLMPVLDDIDAGRQHGDLVDGPFAAIAGKLEGILATYGLARIDEVGVAFDPNIHEALIQQPSADVQSDSVSQILRVGYRKDQRVLRAAQVIVAVPE